jgi:hypothetical protein
MPAPRRSQPARIIETSSIVCAALVGCGFDGSYAGGHFRCSDGACPSGMICVAQVCMSPDAGAIDAPRDARIAALTCADPGVLPAGGGSASGSTAGRANAVTSTCGGAVMNGPDATYRVTVAANAHVMIAIAGDYAVSAYAIAPCTVAPGTPLCEGNAAAAPGSPITVIAPAAGDQFVIVDGINPALSGTYTLTVTVTP